LYVFFGKLLHKIKNKAIDKKSAYIKKPKHLKTKTLEKIQMAESKALVKDEKKSKVEGKTTVPAWVKIAGLSLAVVGATAATVYYVKNKSKRELDTLRFAGEVDTEGYTSKISRYWYSGVRTVKTFGSLFSSFFSSNTAPMVRSTTKSKYSKTDAFESDDMEVIDGEPEL